MKETTTILIFFSDFTLLKTYKHIFLFHFHADPFDMWHTGPLSNRTKSLGMRSYTNAKAVPFILKDSDASE